MKAPTARDLRTFAAGGLVVVALVFLLQNLATVEVRFLWWTLALPRAAVLVVLFALGFGAGWLIASLRRRRP